MDVLSITVPVVVGWSYGSEIAIEYAKRYETAGLGIAAGGAYGLTPSWELPMLQLVVLTRAYRMLPPVGPLKALARAAMFHPETPEAVVEDMLETNPLPRGESAWRTVIEGFWGYDGRDGLDAIEVPALVVRGPADKVVPRRAARETARRLPNGSFEEIPKSGHVLLGEQPGQCNRLLEALIRRALASGARS
jgi:pimeloyl-ACP methyl ester carboxylesterase